MVLQIITMIFILLETMQDNNFTFLKFVPELFVGIEIDTAITHSDAFVETEQEFFTDVCSRPGQIHTDSSGSRLVFLSIFGETGNLAYNEI